MFDMQDIFTKKINEKNEEYGKDVIEEFEKILKEHMPKMKNDVENLSFDDLFEYIDTEPVEDSNIHEQFVIGKVKFTYKYKQNLSTKVYEEDDSVLFLYNKIIYEKYGKNFSISTTEKGFTIYFKN